MSKKQQQTETRIIVWPNGWMDQMPLGTEVDLGLGHILLDMGTQNPPKKGTASPPLFDQYLLWPNGRPSQLC